MASLPVVSGHQVIAALQGAGYNWYRQRGSHVFLVHHGPPRRAVTVPLHKELDRGTLRSIIRQAELTVDQFMALLK